MTTETKPQTAYGIPIVQTDEGWSFDCECTAHLHGTSQEIVNIRNAIYDHRTSRRRHATNLAALLRVPIEALA